MIAEVRNDYRDSDSISLQDPRISELFGVPDPTISGIEVNEISALNYSAVYGAVSIVADALACMNVQVMQQVAPLHHIEKEDHPAWKLLNSSPDGEADAFSVRESQQAHCMLRGNTVSEIVRNVRGQAIEYHLLDPRKVDLSRTKSGTRDYAVRDTTGTKHLEESQVLHIPALSWDGFIGKSPITLARESVGLGLATERYGNTFFGRGGKPLGFLTKPNTFTKTQKDTLRAEWQELHDGIRNALNVGILSGGLDWKQIGLNAEEAQFLETRKFQIIEICRWFRIPPHMLGDMENAKFANTENMLLEFMIFTLWPWIKRWENQLNRKLFTRVEQASYYVKFDTSGLVGADSKAKWDAYEKAERGGFVTIEEVRAREGLPPYKDGLGKEPLVMASQMATLKAVESGEASSLPTQGGKAKPDTTKAALMQQMSDLLTQLSELE